MALDEPGPLAVELADGLPIGRDHRHLPGEQSEPLKESTSFRGLIDSTNRGGRFLIREMRMRGSRRPITAIPVHEPAGSQSAVVREPGSVAKAKDLRGSIASRDPRAEQPVGLRQDAVSYCLQALRLFEGMERRRFMAVLSELAAVGQGGLRINEPCPPRPQDPAR
ncbi:MAG: hypothetical protein ACK41W_16945 [Cyanobacteriota bacterium]